jgi:hypothetical protein
MIIPSKKQNIISVTGDLFTKKMTGPRRSHATVPSAISKYFFKFLFRIILFPVSSDEDANDFERGKSLSLSCKEKVPSRSREFGRLDQKARLKLSTNPRHNISSIFLEGS